MCRMRIKSAGRFLLVAALMLCASQGIAVASAVPADESVNCQDVTVPVMLTALPVSVSGRLCIPDPAPTTVQVLLHGGTYNSAYWDFPYKPETYSYARAANSRGYATFNFDRVGYGASTRPPSVTLTALDQADVVHQIVTRLRAGTIGSVAFPDVVLVGHSMGSATAVLEASVYQDVQGVVLTGMTHRLDGVALTNIFLTGLHPALLDPKFGPAYDAGYLTTIPGKRAELYYVEGDYEPGVVATDEATKDVVSTTEVSDDSAVAFTAPVSLAISVPVFLAVGSEDRLFCGFPSEATCADAAALKAAESPYFDQDAQLSTYVLPNAGHDIGLSVRAPLVTTAILDWADQHVGS